MITQQEINFLKSYKIGRYFNLWELVRSQHFDCIVYPSSAIVARLILGAQMLLIPLRQYLKKPVRINSGYRSAALNKKISGAKNSDHLSGCAFDVNGGDWKRTLKIFNFYKRYGYYRQLILYDNFVHVSYNLPGKQFKSQILYKVERTASHAKNT